MNYKTLTLEGDHLTETVERCAPADLGLARCAAGAQRATQFMALHCTQNVLYRTSY